MRVRLKGINRVTKLLADGSLATYWYAWKGGARIVPCDCRAKSHGMSLKMARPNGFEPLTPRLVVWWAAPVSEGQLVDHCGNKLRQGHHVTSQKSGRLRVTRQTK